jgi:hypothetical protein
MLLLLHGGALLIDGVTWDLWWDHVQSDHGRWLAGSAESAVRVRWRQFSEQGRARVADEWGPQSFKPTGSDCSDRPAQPIDSK